MMLLFLVDQLNIPSIDSINLRNQIGGMDTFDWYFNNFRRLRNENF